MLIVTAIPAFSDNYIWAIHNKTYLFVVDPGDHKPVIQFMAKTNLKLAGILITHHHYDHTGGVKSLINRHPIPVYSPDNPAIGSFITPVKEGEEVLILGHSVKVLTTPGHTLDHISYFIAGENKMAPMLFCGDTLFSGGCGRLFEGTAKQMQASLDKLASLPDATQVYCAHEYTRSNLAFAVTIDRDNTDLQAHIKEVDTLRQLNTPSLPSTISLEKKINPFMRTRQPSIINSVTQKHPLIGATIENNPSAILSAIRTMKDNF
ncbi:MAG: hydroxyacylglutathione hydrolase [Candidatus Endonucleobacter bathymodioli]|uniref:Hydroxyacylglutathione hydrolase n=1 Tax=Candidatus Endonucleibacter bathymodioli TaxID=539814 RepID=A0AA90P252_9GAMM|nr:hydroxyacylglutathione hydrolase [Candidatus Endonucleobacter bathymodioli]